MLTFGSVFTGIGGLDLGLERAGMQCLWQVEWNEWCRGKLAKHWPYVTRRFCDARELPWWLRYDPAILPAVDLLCGGWPCQPHSVAGKRQGAADDRHLWPAMFEIVQALRPTWFLGENVPGIVTTILDDVLSDLEGFGYTCRPFVVPACAVDAPHRRDRVWIVAYTDTRQRHFKGQAICPGRDAVILGSQVGPDPWGERLAQREGVQPGGAWPLAATTAPCRWDVEPGMDRVVDGLPDRVDRVMGLGNAVVPQLAEVIGRMIVAVHYAEVA